MFPVTSVPRDPVKIWKQMGEARRLHAAEAFWKEQDGVEQQVEAVALLARHLKARPKFVQGLPVERRARYLAHYPGMPEVLAARLLVSYHLGCQRAMLRAFLDALGIPHEDGLIANEVEGAVSPDRLQAGIAALEASFPPGDVSLYLATLLAQDPDTWGGLADFPQTQRAFD
jgi:hypothetical protein